VLAIGYAFLSSMDTWQRVMAVNLSVGARVPAYATSMGRVLLAGLRPDQLDRYFAAVSLPPLLRSAKQVSDQVRRR
jgi:DNA-binding IclR family transcriptional regulator